jgi:hypothetical protein
LGKLSSTYTYTILNYEHLSRLNVVWGIDGLEDTNHLYRQDVEWNKVMDRVKWFIDAGGHATWKWIPFLHNKHQDIIKIERLGKEETNGD